MGSHNIGCFHCQVVSAMVNNDLLSIVNTRPLKSWKETLALLCSVSFITPDEKSVVFVILLGSLQFTLELLCAFDSINIPA